MIELERHLAHCSLCQTRLSREERLFQRSDRAAADLPCNYTYASMWTPLGTVWVAGGAQGLVAVEYGCDESRFVFETERRLKSDVAFDQKAFPQARQQIREYLAGTRRAFSLPLDHAGLTAFQVRVYQAAVQVPYGETVSYGDLASRLGMRGAGRAVGGALARCPFSFVVPCHRVVRAGGAPGNYAPQTLGACGAVYQRALIELESTRKKKIPSIQ